MGLDKPGDTLMLAILCQSLLVSKMLACTPPANYEQVLDAFALHAPSWGSSPERALTSAPFVRREDMDAYRKVVTE
jgi:hypothetical protein